MASKAELETKLRNLYLEMIKTMISEKVDTDALEVSASELTVPCLDEEGNEKFILIKVSVPRGTRNGEGSYTPYDGYAAAEDYKCAKESKAQERAVKKAMKEAEKGKKKGE